MVEVRACVANGLTCMEPGRVRDGVFQTLQWEDDYRHGADEDLAGCLLEELHTLSDEQLKEVLEVKLESA